MWGIRQSKDSERPPEGRDFQVWAAGDVVYCREELGRSGSRYQRAQCHVWQKEASWRELKTTKGNDVPEIKEISSFKKGRYIVLKAAVKEDQG